VGDSPPGIEYAKVMDIRKVLPKDSKIIEGFHYSALTGIIKSYGDCLLLACSYSAIISKSIVGLGVVNIHGGILPYHRGANMLNWAIINSWEKTGITLHYMEETLDSGNIIDTIEYPIFSDENVNDVKMRMFAKTTELLDKNLPALLSGKAKSSPQDHTLAKYYPKRKLEDGKIDWHKNAVDIHNLIRALVFPYPGAYCQAGGEEILNRVVIEKACVRIDNKYHSNPGKIIKINNDNIVVTTGYNLLGITEIRCMLSSKFKLSFKEGDYFE